MVVVIDDHRGLCESKTSKYLGLSVNPSMFAEESLMSLESCVASQISPKRFGMDAQLRVDSTQLVGMYMKYGRFPVCIQPF